MAFDPVCNMTVGPVFAGVSEEYEGTRFYFCSEGCHRRLVASPSAIRCLADTRVGYQIEAIDAMPIGIRLNTECER